MTDLIRHIEYLLTQHDCVVVPGLGGFVLQYVPARFSEDRRLVLPPGKQMVFNPSLSYNDGLLAHSLMRSDNLDYASAVTVIENSVARMKDELSGTDDSFVFGDLGTFYLTKEQSLIFEPDSSYLLSLSSFGLRKINMRPLDQLHKEENAVRPDESEEKRDVIYISLNRTFIRRIAVAAAVIIGLLMISTPISETNTSPDYASIVSAELLQSIVPDTVAMVSVSQAGDSLSVSGVEKKDSETVESALEKITDEKESVSESDDIKPYIIVVATLSGKQAALRQLEHFKKQGIKDDLKIYETPNKVRIYIDSFSNKEDAQKFMMNLRTGDSSFPDAWVMSVK